MTTSNRGRHQRSRATQSPPPSFVGRGPELATLVEALPVHHAPGGRLWLVEGEAGIGKTRLVRELAVAAEAAGCRVVWGRCWDETGTPPYWPWTQVVRRLRRIDSGTDLTRLVLGDERDDPDPFALYDAVAAEIARAASHEPTVVVLDDLHRADRDSLRLTRFVLGHLVDARLLVLATLRVPGPGSPEDAAEALRDLGPATGHLRIGGLDVEAVAAMVGEGADAPGIRAVTGGNPLHVQHLVRASSPPSVSGHHEGTPGPHPTATAGALGAVLVERLGDVDAEALELLTALAVLGPAATTDTAAALLGHHRHHVTRSVDALRAAGLVDPDRTRLAHGLVADAVAAVADPVRLQQLHLAAARLGSGSGAPAAEVAHHLCRAGPDHRAEAVAASREAAEVAAASFAHDDAAGHLARALALLDDCDGEAATLTRFEVSLALAGTLERTKGTLAAEPAYREALDAARRTGDPEAVARAAARNGVAFYADPHAQQARAEECRAALAGLDDRDTPLRARLLANVVAADPLAIDRAPLAAEAVAVARRTGDPEATGAALVAEQLIDLGPSTLPARLRTSREIIALAEACGEHDLEVRGRFLLKNALLEAGDVRELDAELAAQDRSISAVGEARFSRHVLWFRCMRAMLDGRAKEAEELADRCLALASELRDPDGFGVYTGQYGVALWLQGRLAELEPVYVDLMRDQPDDPLWPAVVAWIALGDGRPETARGLLDRFVDPARLPQGMHTLLNLFTMADVAAAVGDDDLVARARDALLPYADRAVPIAMGAACFGIVARPLGSLAMRMGILDEAISHFERAIEIAARMGARPWLADAQLALAEAMVAAGRAGEPRVRELVDEAAATTDALDLAVFADRIAALGAVVPPAAEPAPRPVGRPDPVVPSRARIAVLGTFDVYAVDGTRARWQSRKARSLLKVLVARRGSPIAREEVMGMLWPDEAPEDLANRMAVAVSTVRRALDPGRTLPPDALVHADGGSLRLVDARVEIDVEVFLSLASSALAAHRADRSDARDLLRRAIAAYQGEALPDEPYEDWAAGLRSAVSATFGELLRAAAARSSDDGDHLAASDALRRLVELDPYDEPAHLALIETLLSLGAYGQAQACRERYVTRMAELGLPPADPLAGVVGAT